MDNTATLVKDNLPKFRGHAALYRCSPPMEGHEYVVASASSAYSGPETYIFPSNSAGEVTDWGELEGSIRGTLKHSDAIDAAGYRIVSPVEGA